MRYLYEIRKDLEEMANMPCKPNWKKPRTGDVIDEEKSVRWNREEVERLQNAYENEVRKLNTIKNKKRDELYDELYKTIKHEVGNITIEDAKAIFNYAYEQEHSYGYNEVFIHLEEIIDLVSNIVNRKK